MVAGTAGVGGPPRPLKASAALWNDAFLERNNNKSTNLRVSAWLDDRMRANNTKNPTPQMHLHWSLAPQSRLKEAGHEASGGQAGPGQQPGVQGLRGSVLTAEAAGSGIRGRRQERHHQPSPPRRGSGICSWTLSPGSHPQPSVGCFTSFTHCPPS